MVTVKVVKSLIVLKNDVKNYDFYIQKAFFEVTSDFYWTFVSIVFVYLLISFT